MLTGAKSFTGNPIIGSERLNRLGLHEARMRTAARLARHRRGVLTHRVFGHHLRELKKGKIAPDTHI